MITYSLDLRQRIINTVERGKQTKRDIAVFFDVHESFIYKLLRQQRELGHIEPLPHGGGATAVLKEKHRTVLADLVAETPDATLGELRTGLRKKTRLDAGISTLWRALDELNLTVKKKTKRASEADPEARAEFAEQQKQLPIESLIFIDEFGIHLAMSRTHARSLRGTRAIVSEPFQRGQNVSVIGSLGLDGAGPTMAIEGAVDAVAFETYVEFFLVPTLCLDDIVVLDNVQFHHSARARQLIEAAGAKVLHLPTYSPDFNPIEECISKIKAILRSLKARTKRQLLNALAKALTKITIDDICGWFLDCGYVYSFI